MKDIRTAPFLVEICRTCDNMYRLGWDERNGGNISMLLDEDEVKEYIDINAEGRVICFSHTEYPEPSIVTHILI